jgi:hypothetical protein
MSGLATLLLSYSGFVGLALAMERHQEQAELPTLDNRRKLGWRVLGSVLLVLALMAAIQTEGTSVGISFWLGMLSLAGIACALMFSYAPRQVLSSAALVGGAGLLAWLV